MSTVVASSRIRSAEGAQAADIEQRATDSPYADWRDVYRDEKRRGREDVPPNPMKGWC